MSRPPVNPEKTAAGIIVDPHTLERVIPESRRPDGTYVSFPFRRSLGYTITILLQRPQADQDSSGFHPAVGCSSLSGH